MTMGLSSVGLATFTYDSKGNQTVKNIGGSLTTYTYSIENKMVGITYPDSSLNTFSYDGDGKRLQKQDPSGTLRMVYDHQGPTGLYDLAKETDGSNTLVAFYTQGPMLISQRRGGNSYWYQDDALGSTSAITSSDETVTSTYKFYAFGDVLTSSGTLTNAFKFVGGSGYYSDPDSGLLLLRARYYWPSVGRFVSSDPLIESAGITEETGVEGLGLILARYSYAGNTPALALDPTGMWPKKSVHWRATMTWAGARDTRVDCGWGWWGLSSAEAAAVGEGDRWMDESPYWSLNPSSWGIHFNTLSSAPYAPTDSRKAWFSQKYVRAVHIALVHGHCMTALRVIGEGLHAMQDVHAHGPATPLEHCPLNELWIDSKTQNTDWSVTRTMWVAPGPLRNANLGQVYARFFHHWNDPTESRLRQTQMMTKHYVRQFLLDVCCRCGVSKP